MFDALSEYERIQDPRQSKYDESRARTCFRLSMGTVLALFVAYLVFNYVVINGERLAQESGTAPLDVSGASAEESVTSFDFPDDAPAGDDANAVDLSGASDAAETAAADTADADADATSAGDVADTADADTGDAADAADAAAASQGSNAVEKALSHAKDDTDADADEANEKANGEAATKEETGEDTDTTADDADTSDAESDKEAPAEEGAEEDAATGDEADDQSAGRVSESHDGVMPGANSILGAQELHGAQWWLGAGFGFLGLATLVLLCAHTAPTSHGDKEQLLSRESHSYTVLV